jgi:hypothetical protein
MPLSALASALASASASASRLGSKATRPQPTNTMTNKNRAMSALLQNPAAVADHVAATKACFYESLWAGRRTVSADIRARADVLETAATACS